MKKKKSKNKSQEDNTEQLTWADINPVDTICLELGYKLIPLVDRTQGGDLIDRIQGVRKKISQSMGFLIPDVHVMDNLNLSPYSYELLLAGTRIAEYEVHPDKDLAIESGFVSQRIDGIQVEDPAYGMNAVWIDSQQRAQAQALGYTVLDSRTVITNHIGELLKTHVEELFGYEETYQWLYLLSNSYPNLAKELLSGPLSVVEVHNVLRELLEEGIPVRDCRIIAERLLRCSTHSDDIKALIAEVRIGLSRCIHQELFRYTSEIRIVALDKKLETDLLEVTQSPRPIPVLADSEPEKELRDALQKTVGRITGDNQQCVLIVAPEIRYWMERFAKRVVPNVHVLPLMEFPKDYSITITETLGW